MASTKTAEEYLADFAPNVIDRLEQLEAHAKRVNGFLFDSTPERPSLDVVVTRVNLHVSVLCDYADAIRRVLAALRSAVVLAAKVMKNLAIIAAAAGTIVGVYYYLGFGRAIGQVALAAADLNERGSFKDYVLSVWRSPELVHFAVLFAFGCAGVLGNYFWKWITDQIAGSLWTYLWLDHRKRTVASFCCIAGWAVWAVDPTLTWSQTINLALSTGFAIDVLVNKATAREQQQGGNNNANQS